MTVDSRLGETNIQVDLKRLRTLILLTMQQVNSGVGADHNALTLDATVADVFDISAAQVLSADAGLANYDIIITDGAASLSRLAHPGAAGYALVSDGVDIEWDQTPTWTGLHTFGAGITFSGGSGANNVTVPDNLAVALELLDAGGIEYLRLVTDNTQPVILFNEAGANVDFHVEAVGVADALQIQGSDGQITLGVLGAGVVQSTAGGVLSSAAVPLVDIASYAQGSIIIGGAADWEALAHPGGAGYALTTDATDVAWSQTPTWTGLHTFNAGLLIGSGQTADLNGEADALVLDANGDTTISAPTDDQIDIEVSGADDFTFTANSFNVLTGSDVLMADGATIKTAAGPVLTFDDTGNSLELTGGDMHIYAKDFVVYSDGAGANHTMRINYENDFSAVPDIQFRTSVAIASEENMILLLDSDNDTENAALIVGKDAAIDTYTPIFRLTEAAWMGLNETENANITVGLTINQGANDDQILALKSSDVAHGITGVAETDTYGFLKKFNATDGGLAVEGIADTGSVGLFGVGIAVTDNTTKGTTGVGYIELRAYKKDGATVAAPGADANLMVIRSATTTQFIFDQEGSAHANIEWTTFDKYDDVALLSDFESAMLAHRDPVKAGFVDFIKYNRDDLERVGIVAFDDNSPGHAMVNTTRLNMLLVGAIKQLGQRMEQMEARDGISAT